MSAHAIAARDVPGYRVIADGIWFPESPRYAAGKIYFSDGPVVRATTMDAQTSLVAELPTPIVLGLQVAEDGVVLACAAFDRKIYRIVDGTATVAVDLSEVTAAPLNEFVILPGGALLIGSMGFTPTVDPPSGAPLLLISPDGSVRETGPEITFANGMVLRDDGRTLFMVSSTNPPTIKRIALDDEGSVEACTSIMLKTPNVADGMAMTADGTIWYADFHAGGAVAIDETGAPVLTIDIGKSHATSCVAFEADGEEWLVISGTDDQPISGEASGTTGRLIAVPLAGLPDCA